MIVAYYAVGPNGEFGLDGKLPWGSFPEELQALKDVLKLHRPDTVLMGLRSWKLLPTSFKKFLLDEVCNSMTVCVYARRSFEAVSFSLAFPDIRVLLDIDYSTKEFFEGAEVALLGGAHMLEKAFDAGIVDGAVISHISRPGVSGFKADVVLRDELWDVDKLPPKTSVLMASGHGKFTETERETTNQFIQEYHFFGTV